MKKENIPQGNNKLTAAIESFMKEWGGNKYQKATLAELEESLINRLDPIIAEEKGGAIQLLATNLKRRVKSHKTKEELLMDANETMFKFFEGGM
jgi:hypothetical protein